MPEVSRFYGIIIRFYYLEHPPRPFYAIDVVHEALIEIETGDVHEGWMPRTAYDLVNTWRLIHLQELRSNWDCARQQQPLIPRE